MEIQVTGDVHLKRKWVKVEVKVRFRRRESEAKGGNMKD